MSAGVKGAEQIYLCKAVLIAAGALDMGQIFGGAVEIALRAAV